MSETPTRWDDAEFTHTLAQISWMASPAVLGHLNERATGHPLSDWLTGWGAQFCPAGDLRVLVLGCGEGWLERAIAPHGAITHIHAVDFAAEAVARARESAKGIDKITYGVVDLNRDTLDADAYDVVIAHSILHHVENLEHAFAQIELAMRPEAALLVNEYVGPKRFQFSAEVLEIMNRVLVALPERLRRGAVEKRVYDERVVPWIETMIELDPTEAVRSDEIVDFLRRDFDLLDEVRVGGTLLQHLLYDIVQNFRFDDPRERAMLELLCTFEAQLVDHWVIPADFVLAAARKKTAAGPRPVSVRHRANYSPNDDRDPLGFGPVRRRRSGRGAHQRRLPEWALRMLRIALVSTRPKRGLLIEERRLKRRIEQLRYRAAAGATPFDWVIGRYTAVADESDENSRSILVLLETFEAIACERQLL